MGSLQGAAAAAHPVAVAPSGGRHPAVAAAHPAVAVQEGPVARVDAHRSAGGRRAEAPLADVPCRHRVAGLRRLAAKTGPNTKACLPGSNELGRG